ncbi:MAG: asparagine synthase C-terminal domain-containing protein [Chloroflexota bacterium]
MPDIQTQLRHQLTAAVQRHTADAILLSGGLDTSILAYIAKPPVAFTVSFKDAEAHDVEYAKRVANLLSLEHTERHFDELEALETLPRVVSILKTFDPALPNDLTIYFGLACARERDVRSVMTGDGADELFAGYSYMSELGPEALDRHLHELPQRWQFSSRALGKALRIEVKQPFLDPEFVNFALTIGPQLKVKQGTGKYVLRQAFEGLIPGHILWRDKEPIEVGSGSSRLRRAMQRMVSDEEFHVAEKETGIRFMDKEHYAYYRIYKDVVGDVPKARPREAGCPCCGAAIGTRHCQVCGFSLPLNA